MNEFFLSLKSDIIKTRHTFTPWLFWIGVFFLPVIFLFWGLFYKNYEAVSSPTFWNSTWSKNWNYMGSFLPLGIILGTGLIFQVENVNNGWKQLFTYPRTLSELFFSKYINILLIMAACCVFFIVAFSIQSIVLSFAFTKELPVYLPPFDIWIERLSGYLCCFIAILSFQFMLNVIFKNLVISMCTGIVLWMMQNFSYFFFINPFSLFIRLSSPGAQTGTLLLQALLQILVYTGLAFIIFRFKKQKS